MFAIWMTHWTLNILQSGKSDDGKGIIENQSSIWKLFNMWKKMEKHFQPWDPWFFPFSNYVKEAANETEREKCIKNLWRKIKNKNWQNVKCRIGPELYSIYIALWRKVLQEHIGIVTRIHVVYKVIDVILSLSSTTS